MPKERQGITFVDGKCWIRKEGVTRCVCTTDNCNHECTTTGTCEKVTVGEIEMEQCDAQCKSPTDGPSNNDTKPTEVSPAETNKTDPNPTDDGAAATTEEGPKPTDDSQQTGNGNEATGEGGPQPTEEKNEGTQQPTGTAATNSGNQRVGEANLSVFAIWILVTLVIRSIY